MHVESYELFEVPPRWLFLKLTTSTGLVGWGEPVVEGRVKTVRAAVGELLDSYVIGEDPLQIEDHWQAMYKGGFYRGGPILMSALAGIDQALWDIKGKHYGLPVYEFLSGKVRDRIRVFQWIGGDRPEDVASEAKTFLDAGYTALKMDANQNFDIIDTPQKLAEIVERVSYVRNVVGPDVDLALDCRGRITKPMAKRLLAWLEPLNLLFVEEPISPEYNHLLSEISPYTTTPLATGERLYSRLDCRSTLEDGTVDVLQPNVSHAGGISEMYKIALMAETRNVAIAPNCPLGPIALAASVQVDTAIPDFLVQDHGFGRPNISEATGMEYLENPDAFSFNSGYLEPLDEPGLGIKIDEDVVQRRSEQDVSWQSPLWRRSDGSVAGW